MKIENALVFLCIDLLKFKAKIDAFSGILV